MSRRKGDSKLPKLIKLCNKMQPYSQHQMTSSLKLILNPSLQELVISMFTLTHRSVMKDIKTLRSQIRRRSLTCLKCLMMAKLTRKYSINRRIMMSPTFTQCPIDPTPVKSLAVTSGDITMARTIILSSHLQLTGVAQLVDIVLQDTTDIIGSLRKTAC